MKSFNCIDEPIAQYTPREYPRQIAAFKREGQVCGIDANFNIPSAVPAPGRKPQGFFEATRLSYFRLTMLNTKNGLKRVYANIPMEEIPGIVARMEMEMCAARTSHVMARVLGPLKAWVKKILSVVSPAEGAAQNTAHTAANSPAYKVKLTVGTFKGKTPAQVILEDPANSLQRANDLCQQYTFLMQNASKFKGNVQQAEAIDAAIKLYNAGQLTAEAAEQTDTTGDETGAIYDMEPGTIANKCKDGKQLCYGIHIKYNPEMRYPFELKMCNYLAPMTEGAKSGSRNVMIKERTDYLEDKLLLNVAEFTSVMYHLKAMYEAFLNASFAARYRMALFDYDVQYTEAVNNKTAAGGQGGYAAAQ